MKKKLTIFCSIFLIIPLLAGCWNQEELTQLAFVMALGIDKHKDGYKLTYEIVNPGNVASSQMGGGQGTPIAVYTSYGENLTEAIYKATKEVSRHLYFAHTNIMVISEQVAKEGVLDILDFTDRDPVFRTTTQVFVAKNTSAEGIVSTLTILDKIPVNKIVKSLDTTERFLGENIKITIDDFIRGLVSNGRSPMANGVMLSGNKEAGKQMSNIASDKPEVIIKIDGLAIFRRGKLIGWIDHEKARGIIWVLNKVGGTDVSFDWLGKKKAVNMVARRSKTKVKAAIINGNPVINVKINVEGDVGEANADIDLSNPKMFEKMEVLAEKEIEKEVRSSIRDVQNKKNDVLAFGDKIRRADPKLWAKIKENWEEEFSKLQVNIHVDVFLRRNGIRTKSFWSDLKI